MQGVAVPRCPVICIAALRAAQCACAVCQHEYFSQATPKPQNAETEREEPCHADQDRVMAKSPEPRHDAGQGEEDPDHADQGKHVATPSDGGNGSPHTIEGDAAAKPERATTA